MFLRRTPRTDGDFVTCAKFVMTDPITYIPHPTIQFMFGLSGLGGGVVVFIILFS